MTSPTSKESEILDPRETYPPSIYSTPFNLLPNPKRVWQSTPEGKTLGKLQLLTPETVAQAASEIKTGRRIGINWDLTKLEHSNFGRQSCKHKIIPLSGGRYFDDVVEFNPQQSSQWDGFRHASQPRDLRVDGGLIVDDGGKGEDRVFFLEGSLRRIFLIGKMLILGFIIGLRRG